MKLIKINQYINKDCWEIFINPENIVKVEIDKKENCYTFYMVDGDLIHTDKKGFNKIIKENKIKIIK